jgi:KDO2-lipid IV(A) lauroyltransferase
VKGSVSLKKKKVSLLRRIGFVLEAAVVIPLGNLAALLPWKIGRPVAALMGLFIFRLSAKARGQAGRNLDIIYAESPLSSTAKERIIQRLFINIATSAYEYLRIGRLTETNYLEFVRIENPEAFFRAVRSKEGVIVVSAHLGNWEFLGSTASKLGMDLGAVIHRQLNPYTDRWLRKIREKHGKIKCYYDDISDMRRMFSYLRAGGTVALLADERQSARPVYVPFFGRPAATPEGPARLHLGFGSPILFSFSIRQDDGKYLLTVDGPYRFERTGNFKKDHEYVMRQINRRYEEVIRMHPDQWFLLLTPRWE